ncbi:sugar phosphate isomerase/epimerase family protein [Actinoplanes sp. NPDC048988]|uniref:sugar phosphate isomerase/epimerase family protein n=1 Tax=Actinoplanes sp. NPDC048988 TaxID=3363901 RepID=UPI0037184D7C
MRIGVQLGVNGYGMFGSANTRDTVRVLTTVADAGAEVVEAMFNLAPKAALLRGVAQDLGLQVAAVHVFWWELLARQAEVIHYCLQAGARQVIVSHLPASSRSEYERVAQQLRVWAQDLDADGIRLLLHNHAEEMSPATDDQRPAFQILRDELGDSTGFCLDLYWAALAGADLGPLVSFWSDRCSYYHFHDGIIGDPARFTDSVDLGQGSVDLLAAFARIPPGPDTYLVAERKFPPADYRTACGADVSFLTRLISAASNPAGIR